MKSKLFLLTVFALLISSSTLNAQIHLGLGLEGGINIANLSTTPDVSTSSRSGLIIGGLLDISFSRMFSLQPEIRFVMRGASYTDAPSGDAFVGKFNYLEFPVLLKVKFPLTEVKPYLVGGPVLAVNMSSNVDVTPPGGTTTTTDFSNSTSGADFDLLLGGGVEFKVSSKFNLFGQFAYSFGLSNMLKNVTNATWKHNGFQITVGGIFNLK